MENPSSLVKALLIFGFLLIAIALFIWLAGNKFSWFGKLPGDIHMERENVHIYIPITTMILLSVAVSFIIWVLRKFF